MKKAPDTVQYTSPTGVTATATLTDTGWTSENASLVLWLDQVAPTREAALALGCVELAR